MNKILIWGTGKLAEHFVENKCNAEIIGFIESQKTKNTFMQKPVYECTELPREYDYIIVANSHIEEIYSWCLENHMNISKMIFLYRVKKQFGCTNLSVIKNLFSEKNFIQYCEEFNLLDYSFVEEDIVKYQKLNTRINFDIKQQYLWPVITDKYECAGTISNYFWQDLWAARLIIASGSREHFDIGSRLDGFIAHLLAAGIDVTTIDVRQFPGRVEHLSTIVDDATYLNQLGNESIESISALCSLEHFGLGRYGDPIDPEACFICFDNIQKKLRKGGRLYLSVPVGKERVEFNAHRIFYANTIVECFANLQLEEFSCVSEGRIEYNVDIHKYDNDFHNGDYRYGLFFFIKKK